MSATRDPERRLLHIQDEISSLTMVLADLTYDDFTASYMVRRTCEHALLIISEAVRALPLELLDRYPTPDWVEIRGIGNVLRHEYFAVNPRVIWRIVTTHLPTLAPVIDAMIEDVRR